MKVPDGASGSSTMSVSVFVPSGTFSQDTGGDTGMPVPQVYATDSTPPSARPAACSVKTGLPEGVPRGVAACCVFFAWPDTDVDPAGACEHPAIEARTSNATRRIPRPAADRIVPERVANPINVTKKGGVNFSMTSSGIHANPCCGKTVRKGHHGTADGSLVPRMEEK